MKVAHCIHGLGLGGAQQVIAAIVRGSPEGIRSYVYTSNDGVLCDPITDAGATVHVIERKLPKLDPFWALRLAGRMSRDRIDVVHTHLFGDSLHGYLAARVAGGLPVLMTLHTCKEGLNPLQQVGYRWLLPRCDRVVACSEAVRRSFEKIDPVAATRMMTIPNGIEATRAQCAEAEARERLLQLFGLAPSALVVAALGRLVEEKGHRWLLTAFARLSHPQARLILLGDGPLRSRLEEQARREGLAGRVIFAGFRPDAAELLGGVDVVVFSSLYEGLPMALLESMAAGRCLVVTDVPGMTGVVTDGREGLVAAVGDPAALTESLERALADPELRHRLGDAARRRFLERYTAEGMVSAYVALYQELAAVDHR